jgi:hypothetical protein
VLIVELVAGPFMGFGMLYSQDNPFSSKLRDPRGKLDMYYRSAQAKETTEDWDSLIRSGREILSAEWESKANLELESLVLKKKAEEGEDFSLDDFRRELLEKKAVVRGEWEEELSQEINRKRGEWKAQKGGKEFSDFWEHISREEIRAAIEEADALVRNMDSAPEERLSLWETQVNEKLRELWESWNASLGIKKGELLSSITIIDSETRAAFEIAIARMERQVLERYKWEEGRYLQVARANLVMNLNKERDIEDRIALSTNPTELVAALIEKTKLKVDEETGKIREDIISGRTDIPVEISLNDSDPQESILSALENGNRLWEQAIEELIVRKLEYDKLVKTSREEGERAWSEAYNELLKERNTWIANFQKDLSTGIRAWDTSEAKMKENQEAALRELDRYVNSRMDEWGSHIRSLESIAISSANSIKTIIDSKKNLEEMLSKLPTGHSSRPVYQNQINGWNALLDRFREAVRKAEEHVHLEDMRGEYGFLSRNSPDRIMTTAELDLAIAEADYQAALREKERATDVLRLAQNSYGMSPAEVQSAFVLAQAAFQEQQMKYATLLYALNGTVGTAGNVPNTEVPTFSGGESILDRLESAREGVELLWRELELASASMEEARRKYEELAELQIYALNPALMAGFEIGIVESEVTEANPNPFGLRYQIQKSYEEIREAKERIRQAEIEVYRKNYERNNAERARAFYNDITSRIRGYELEKESLESLQTLLSTGDIEGILNSLINEFPLGRLVGVENEARLRGDIQNLKERYGVVDTEVGTTFGNWKTVLKESETTWSDFPALGTEEEKLALEEFSTMVSLLGGKLPAHLRGIYTDSWIPLELIYLNKLLEDWDDEHEKVKSAKEKWIEYLTDHSSRLEGIAGESEPGRTEFLYEMDEKYRDFLRSVSNYESYINDIKYIREELRESVNQVVGSGLTNINATMMGEARKNAIDSLNGFRTEFGQKREASSEVLKAHYDTLDEIGSDVSRYLNSFQEIRIAQTKRSETYSQLSQMLNGLLQNQKSRAESLRLQVEFLLDSDASPEELARIQREEELKIKREAAEMNLEALQRLSEFSKKIEGSEDKLHTKYLNLQKELDELQKNWKPDANHRKEILIRTLMLQFIAGNSRLLVELGAQDEDETGTGTDEVEEFWKSYLDYAEELRDFYVDKKGEFNSSEIDRIKREGSASERRLLGESNAFGQSFFFGGSLLSEYQNRFMVSSSFEAFSREVLSGRIASIFTDSKYKLQEDGESGILASFKTFYEDRHGSLPTSASIQSGGLSASQSVQMVQALRDFLMEKAASGGVFNPELMRGLNEIAIFTDRIEDWQYVLDHYEKSPVQAQADLEEAKSHRKALDEMGKVFRALSDVLGKTNGEPMYHDRKHVENLVAQLERLQSEVGVSTELSERIGELKEFVWGIYKREIAEIFLSGRVIPPGERADDDRPTTFTEFIDALKLGKFILSGGNGNQELGVRFFGRTLTEDEITEITAYLKLFEGKAKIWKQESISDLEEFLMEEDEELKDTLRLQILYEKYERINLAIFSGAMINPDNLPTELRNYAMLKAFEMFRKSRETGLTEDGDKNSFLLFIGPELAEKYRELLAAYVSMDQPKTPSMYLPEDLKELDAVLEYYYNPGLGDTIDLPDQAALAEWLEDRGYDPSFQEKLNTSARLGYMLDMYYGEELESFIREMNDRLGGITPEEERLLVLTLYGYDPLPIDGKWLEVNMDVYHDLSAENFWLIYRQDALHDSLLDLIGKEQEKLGREMDAADKDIRKKNFLNNYKKGTVTSESYLAYLNIPSSGEVNINSKTMVEKKIEELSQHANMKLGSYLGMLETLSSYAFLEPEGESDDPSRLSLSILKTQELIRDYYDPTSSYTRDGEGVFSFEEDLGNQVLTRLNQYVNANSQEFSNTNSFSIVQSAMGLWESMKNSILSAAKKIQTIKAIDGGNLTTMLTQFHDLLQAEEDRFNIAKEAFERANELISEISREYAEKQKEVSEEYKTLLTLEKNLSKYESLTDYLALLEFSKHPIGEDEDGNIIYDTTVKSPLELARERKEKADKKFQEAVKKKEDAEKRVAEQVTLQEIQQATIQEKQITEEWALRSMRFSRAEDLIREEVNTLTTQIINQKQQLYDHVQGLLGLTPGGRGAHLNSYLDTTSTAFISQEQMQREIHYYADLIQSGSLDHWSFVAVALQVREPGQGHEKWNSSNVPNAARNPPAGIRSLHEIIRVNQPPSIMGVTQPILNALAGGGIIETVNLPVRSNFMSHSDIWSAVAALLDPNPYSSQGLMAAGNNYASSTCNQDDDYAKFACYASIGTQIDGVLRPISDTNWTLGNQLGAIGSRAQAIKQRVARLKHLTEITSSTQLLSVLSETKWGLEASDLEFLKNTTGALSALQWTVGDQTVSFNQMVGEGGKPIAQQKKLTNVYGNYQRNGNNHVETLGVSGNEFMSVLSVLAETQYTIARDAYFAKQESVTNTKGRLAERRDILDDREQFLYTLLGQVRTMGIEYGMYQTVLRDYMGSDMSSGGRTVTTRISVVDEIAQMGIGQQRQLQLKDWEIIENNFYQKRGEWIQNMDYLRTTGLQRFDRITTQFSNDWYAWRQDFNQRAEEGEKKYIDAIEETLEAKKQWGIDFAEAAQNPSKRATLNDLYNRIQSMITEINSGLPNGISSNVNANDILSKYHNQIPDSIDRRWIESATNVNTDFFLTRISNKQLNAKDLMEDFSKLQDEMSDRLEVLARLQALHNLQLYNDQYGEIITNANEGLQRQLDQE